MLIWRLLGPTTTTVRWWDRVAYAISLVILVGVAFYQGTLGSRLSDIEKRYEDRSHLTESRYAEDHTLLMSINAAKEQRTAILDLLERRIARLEASTARRPLTGGR